MAEIKLNLLQTLKDQIKQKSNKKTKMNQLGNKNDN